MVGHGGSSAGSYLADPTSPTPSHCASIVATSTVRVNFLIGHHDKSMMAEWIGQMSQRHDMYCHDLKVMGSMNLGCIVPLFKYYLNQNTKPVRSLHDQKHKAH